MKKKKLLIKLMFLILNFKKILNIKLRKIIVIVFYVPWDHFTKVSKNTLLKYT